MTNFCQAAVEGPTQQAAGNRDRSRMIMQQLHDQQFSEVKTNGIEYMSVLIISTIPIPVATAFTAVTCKVVSQVCAGRSYMMCDTLLILTGQMTHAVGLR